MAISGVTDNFQVLESTQKNAQSKIYTKFIKGTRVEL